MERKGVGDKKRALTPQKEDKDDNTTNRQHNANRQLKRSRIDQSHTQHQQERPLPDTTPITPQSETHQHTDPTVCELVCSQPHKIDNPTAQTHNVLDPVNVSSLSQT